MIDQDSDTARLDMHRKASSALGGIPPNPATMGWVHIDSVDTDCNLRTRLIDLGWRPPVKPVDQPQCPVVAWMHPTSNLVTVDPGAYTGLAAGAPRELVLKDDVVDHIEWLEMGIDEWRSYAAKLMVVVLKKELAK